MEGIFVGKN